METSPDRTGRSGTHARSGPLLRVRDADATPGRHRAPAAGSREGTRARTQHGGRARTSPWPLGRGSLAAGAAGAVVLLAGGWAVVTAGDDARPGATGAGPAGPAAAPTAAPTAAPPTAAPTAAPTVAAPLQAAPAGPSAAVAAATAPGRTAADARTALEEQLAARADATVALLRATWEGDEATAGTAARALAASGSGVSAVVTAWRDAATAAEVRTGLDQQAVASRDYAAAVAAGDTVAADDARARMGEVSRGLGAVLAGLTGGRIAAYVPPQDAARHRDLVDALEAGDTAAAEQTAGWLRERLAREGAALAAGLADDRG